MKNICVITGSRAEYGLLRPLITGLAKDDYFRLQIITTGMHLSPEFGMTYKDIEEDGFHIDEKVEILLSSDSPVGISKSMGLAMISFSECFARLEPDLIVVLGDRYEIFAAVSAASIARIPVAHIHGGETTEGAFDEAFRHSITKMSYLHFTSTEAYRNRVVQLGEYPERVFNVGAIGLENIKKLNLLSKVELERDINFEFGVKTALVAFHPVTLENTSTKKQFGNLLSALASLKDFRIIFTKSNSDTDGRVINQMIDNFVLKNKDRAISFTSLGSLRYLSAMQHVDVVIGNSSSGIIEAPSLKVPTVNIGDRQKGRIQADSIINCLPEEKEILSAINTALSDEFKSKLNNLINPYGEGNVSGKIIKTIKSFLELDLIDIKKTFHDLEVLF